MATIDELTIELQTKAKGTENGIDKLAVQLDKLAVAVNKVPTSKMISIGAGLKSISAGALGINGSKALEIKKLSNALNAINKVDTNAIHNSANAMKQLASGLKDMSNVAANVDGIKNVANVINKIGNIKFSGDIKGVSGLAESIKELGKLKDISIPEIKVENLDSVASTIKKISKIDTGNIPQVAKGLEEISGAISIFSSVNIKDSGIDKLVNSLNRLFKADFGKFRPESFERIAKSIRSLGKIPDVSNSLNRFVASISKLSNAGDKAGIVAAELPKIGNALEKSIAKMASAQDVSESINMFVQSIGKLAGAGAKTGQTAEGLKDLSQGVLEFLEAMKKAPKISENTLRIIEALARLSSSGGRIKKSTKDISDSFGRLSRIGKSAADLIANAFKSMMQAASKAAGVIKNAFGKIGQFGSNAANSIKNAASGITSAISKIKNAGNGLESTSFSLKNIAKTLVGFKAFQGISSFGKSAIELGSDITEVENVVDTAFGSMADKAYDFASKATKQFGLSELAAKQYSGTMMAMLKSSGVAQGAAADMSVTLAGLAGDIASFYNIETDEAFYKLRAAIAGETEPMKALGVNMNIVNLEAYAMSQGITKAYKDMTLAEQSILRYNYIIAKTGDAQGDFARTAGTWANQLRLLRLNIQSISAIIGQGLIAALLPAIKLLNKFMAKLTEAAKKFRDFMYVLFGKKIEAPKRGIVDDMADMVDYNTDLSGIGDSAEDIADGMDDASDGMDSAADSAKKLEKALSVLGFDELNQLNADLKDLDTSKVTGNKGKDKDKDLGLDDLGLGNMDDMFDDLYDKQEIEPVNEWARRIREAFLNHDWEGLGKVIAEMVNTGLRKIYDGIKKITPKVESALRAFAKVFNSFVKWLDWDLLGRTIGAGINLLARAFNALFGPGGIDLEQLGRKLSVGLRGMIDEIDWRGLGNAIGNYFMIAWRIASGFVEDMWRIDPKTLTTGWEEVGNALAEGVHGIFERINFKQIGETISGGFNGIIEIISSFRDRMASNHTWSMIAIGVSEGFNSIIDNIDLSRAAQEIGGLALDILHAMNQSAELTHWSEFGYKVAEGLFSVPWLQLFNQTFDLVSATFGEALGGFINYLTTHAEQLGQSFATVFNTLFDKIKYITSNIPWDDIGKGISTFLNTSIANIRPVEAAQNLGNFVTSLLGTMLQVAQGTDWNALGRLIGDFLVNIPWAEMIGQAFGIITNVFGGLITGLGGKILEKMPEIGTALAGGFNHAFQVLKEFVASVSWTDIGLSIATGLNNMIHGINWKEAGKTFGGFVKGVIDVIFTVAMNTDWVGFARGIGDFLDGIPWLEILSKVASTIGAVVGEVIAGLFDTTSGKFLLGFAGLKLLLKGVNLGNTALEIANDFAHKFGLLPDGINLTIPKVVEGVKNLSSKFSPIIDKAKDVVTKVAEKLGFLPRGVTDAIPGISSGVERIAGESGLFSKILSGASGLVSKIGPILGKIGTVIFSPKGAIIAAIIAAVALIIMNWDKIKEAAGKVKDWVLDKWEGIKEKGAEIWGNIKESLGTTWENLKEKASEKFGQIKETMSSQFEKMQEISISLSEKISTGLGNAWDSIKTKAGDIWGAITGKVSGANSEAESNTATTWGNTKENLSGNLSAMASSVASVMSSINATVSASMAQISNTFLTGWQTIAGATGGVLRQTQSEVMMMMQSIKALIAMSMQEIGGIFANGWNTVTAVSSVAIEQINSTVAAKMTAMKATIVTSMQQITSAFSSSWTAIGSMSVVATTRMLSDVSAKMTNMTHVVSSSMKTIGSAYASGWKSSESAASSALSRMQSIVTSKMNAIQNTISSKMNAVKSVISGAMNNIQSIFQTKWTAIGNAVTQALNKIQSTIKSKMNAMKNNVNTAMASIYNIFKTKWESIGSTCSQALNKMQSTVSSKMSAIKNTIRNSMNSIVTSYQNGMNKLPNITSNTLTRVVNEFNKIPNRIGSSLNNNMLTAGKNAAISFANGIKSVHIPTPHIRVASWTQHRAGDSTYSTPNFGVNWYKTGGLAYNPSVVGIGEAGPEAILPLESNKTMGMIADSILDNYSGGINEDTLANAVAEGVAMALMSNADSLSGNSQRPINITVKLENDEAIARAAIRGQQSIDYRMNPTPQYG